MDIFEKTSLVYKYASEAQELAGKGEERSLNEIEASRGNFLVNEMERLIAEIKIEEKGTGYRMALPGDPPLMMQEQQWNQRNSGYGQGTNPDELRLYRHDESMADAFPYNLPDGIRANELSFGRWAVGLLTGNWRNAEAERRTMGTFDDTLGGYVTPTPISQRVIDLARNKSVLMGAGMLTAPMESNTLTIARVTQDPTGVWKAEGASHTPSDVNFGPIVLNAKTLMASTKISIELIEDSGPSAAQVIENSLAQSMAVEMDRAGLFGTGANSEPLGIYNAEGLSQVDPNAALTDYEDFVDAWVKCLEANGMPSVKLYSPAVAGVLAKLTMATELAPLPAPKPVEDLRTLISTQIPNTLGGGADRSVAFVGGFENVLMGVRNNIRIEASREAGDSFEKGLVWIRAYMRGDFAVTQPAQICKITNIDFS